MVGIGRGPVGHSGLLGKRARTRGKEECACMVPPTNQPYESFPQEIHPIHSGHRARGSDQQPLYLWYCTAEAHSLVPNSVLPGREFGR
ncbi:uncharacterized protein PgNI_09967 [Pyricularia grisea]|uniref:Uncharacterized protein n=1 Tax=Pyricularia grisea TaxID=148305 RepID=A0A6P8ARA6_PYRGI|nr:uncharacterized protein PgNI_09967 [Pyricularia grisea]TLD04664.1 hypothetical protein PgNI_09967 [Pyricularia grisea]